MSFGLGGLGAGLGRLGSNGGRGIDPLAPGTPVLTWDGNSADTTPNFSVDLPHGNGAPLDAAVGDVLRVQVSAAGANVWSAYVTPTLDAGNIAGNPITVTGATPLANGTYDFRARLERGTHIGSWSAIKTATVAAPSAAITYRGSGTSTAASATVASYSIDIGPAAIDRLVTVGLVIQNTSPTITSLVANSVALTQDILFTGGNIVAIYSGIVSAGSGSQTIVLNTTGAAFLERDIHVWTMTGLASSTKINTGSGGFAFNIDVTQGDFLIAIDGLNGVNSRTFDTSTVAPAANHTTTWLLGAEWTIATTNASFSVTDGAGGSNRCAASYH